MHIQKACIPTDHLSIEIMLRWMPHSPMAIIPTLVLVLAWYRQATNLYLNKCWPISMSPYVATLPRWVNRRRKSNMSYHDDVIKWNIFRVTGHLCGEFTAQGPVTRSFDVFFDQRLNKRLNKHSWGWWFETLSRPLGRHCNSWYGNYHSWWRKPSDAKKQKKHSSLTHLSR